MKYAFIVLCFLCAMLSSTLHALAGPYVLLDVSSGRVLAANRASDPWHPASLTKLMSIYVAMEAVQKGELTLNSPVTMTTRAVQQTGGRMGLGQGQIVTLENAIKMVLVKSANDVVVAMGQAVSGSYNNFIVRMNETASNLGMTGTHFANAHGLQDAQQVTTARDMAILALTLHRRFPELQAIYSASAIRLHGTLHRSHNALLQHYDGVNGMKTGFICAAGYNLVALARAPRRNLIAVVLGEPTEFDRAEKAAFLFELAKQRRLNERGAKLAHYNPQPTRTSRINMRNTACSNNRQTIRSIELELPMPNPLRSNHKRDIVFSASDLKDYAERKSTRVSIGGITRTTKLLKQRKQAHILDVFIGGVNNTYSNTKPITPPPSQLTTGSIR